MKLLKSIFLSTLFLINPVALFGDDKSDVIEVIKTWASLEGDLNEQAELIRSDRVMIAGAYVWPDQELSLIHI